MAEWTEGGEGGRGGKQTFLLVSENSQDAPKQNKSDPVKPISIAAF